MDKQIHCEILEQRGRSVQSRIDPESANGVRLQTLLDSLKVLKSGGAVNQSKLTDLKFEGKYATVTSAVKSVDKHVDLNPRESALTTVFKTANANNSYWTTMRLPYRRRCNAKRDAAPVFQAVALLNNQEACQWIRDNPESCSNTLDENGSNALIVASSIGREVVLKEILNRSISID